MIEYQQSKYCHASEKGKNIWETAIKVWAHKAADSDILLSFFSFRQLTNCSINQYIWQLNKTGSQITTAVPLSPKMALPTVFNNNEGARRRLT